ncbi:MAG: metallophosphoesterase [Myxococcales bacterium]|nr:metallophosphoesterase [Myxococcales bacterium]
MARDIIIGDIHGCFDELLQLLDAMAVTDDDRLISVGDLVDRGPQSAEVWEFFRDRPGAVVLMGNHERKHVRGVLTYAQQIVELQLGERYPEFRAWAATLPYYHELPEVLVVHGGFEDGVPLASQREDVLAGTTAGARYLEHLHPGRYWTEVYSGTKPIVFGHHVVGDRVQTWSDRVWGIDTGACHGGYLSALVLPGFEVHQVKARHDHWQQQRQAWQLPVLRSRPWADYTFERLERELAGLRRREHPDVLAFRRGLEAWVAQARELVPALLQRVAARTLELEPCLRDRSRRGEVAREPAAALLFACHAGTLGAQTIEGHLPRPMAIVEAARAYGIDTQHVEAPWERPLAGGAA